MTNQAPNLLGSITPDQLNVLSAAGPTELTPEAQAVIKGLGSTMLENDYALVVETDASGQQIPKGYVALRESDMGTVIAPRKYEDKGLPPLEWAQQVMADQHAQRVSDHVAGKVPYFGPQPGTAAGARETQAPLTADHRTELEARRGRYVSQAEIDGINAARSRGLHLS